MGTLRHFDIEKIKSEFSLVHLVETGTNDGAAIDFCLQFDLKTYSSIELRKNIFEQTQDRFRNHDNVFLYCGESFKLLPEILKKINPSENVLFWLDAHLPSFYSHEYDRTNVELEFPLEKELINITRHRHFVNDYFIIDDLRIYENGNGYAGGDAPLLHKHPEKNDIEFIEKLFYKTHNIIRDSRSEGYLILEPIKRQE